MWLLCAFVCRFDFTLICYLSFSVCPCVPRVPPQTHLCPITRTVTRRSPRVQRTRSPPPSSTRLSQTTPSYPRSTMSPSRPTKTSSSSTPNRSPHPTSSSQTWWTRTWSTCLRGTSSSRCRWPVCRPPCRSHSRLLSFTADSRKSIKTLFHWVHWKAGSPLCKCCWRLSAVSSTLFLYWYCDIPQYDYKYSMNGSWPVITGVEFSRTAATQGAHHLIRLI